MDPEHRAYLRDQEISIESALKAARMANPSATPYQPWDPWDFLEQFLDLVDDETFAEWRRVNDLAGEAGEPPAHKLSDFMAETVSENQE